MSGEEWRPYRRLSDRDRSEDVADELAFHLERRTESLMEAGLDEATARREALRRLGDVAEVVRRCREEGERTWRRRRLREVVMTAWLEAKQAVRGLSRRPGFVLAASGTLALGIAATTAVYGMVDAVLLAPLPYESPEELVVVASIDGEGERQPVARSAAAAWRLGLSAVEDFALYNELTRVVSGVGEPEEVTVVQAEHNLLELLRATPQVGRGFDERHRSEGGSGNAVLLSWRLWQQRFGGDPQVVGSTIELQETSYEIVGVMPAEFEFPVGGGAAAWVPLVHGELDDMLRDTPIFDVVARLAPGVTAERAAAELGVAIRQVAATGTDAFGGPVSDPSRPWSARVTPAREAMLTGDAGLLMMLGAVALLWVIACANVANLFLVRASERRRELAVRAALGGGRGDVARPLLLEVLLVCALSAALGLVLAHWAAALLVRLDPGGLPRWTAIRVSGPAWYVATVSTLLAAVACGLVPALLAGKVSAADALRGGERSTASRGGLRLRDAIVGAEIALVFALLVGAGLLLRSFDAVRSVDAGFEIDRLLTARVVLPIARYPRDGEATIVFYDRLFERLRTMPDVRAAGAVSAVPMSDVGVDFRRELLAPGTNRTVPGAASRWATPGYFSALGVPIRGRDFSAQDRRGAPRVVIVNQTLARLLYPGEDALGQRFLFTATNEAEIVGIVPDIRHDGPERTAPPEFYAPYTQFPFLPGLVLLVRTIGEAATFAPTLIGTVREIDPELPVANVQTMEWNYGRKVARRRFDLLMLGGIATAALGLAAVGVFGVMAQAVNQRRRELGIRRALGAQSSAVVRHVLGHTIAVTAAGLLAGSIGAIVFARALRGLLFGMEPLDGVTFVVSACVIALIGTAAALGPALRATRIDPAEPLRGGQAD